MSNYVKGRRAEYYIRDKLRDKGWFCERMASSKPFDLLACCPTFCCAIEVKSYDLPFKQASGFYTDLYNIVKGTDLVPVLIWKKDEKYISTPIDLFKMNIDHAEGVL